jgi:hypothetical protein
MSKTFFLALALIGLAACGSDSKPQAATTHSRSASPKPAATRSKATTKKSKAKSPQRTAARRDTTTQKNPLTNH